MNSSIIGRGGEARRGRTAKGEWGQSVTHVLSDFVIKSARGEVSYSNLCQEHPCLEGYRVMWLVYIMYTFALRHLLYR